MPKVRYEEQEERDQEDQGWRKRVQKPTRYTFAVQGSLKVPTVQALRIKLGEIINTSFGPHRIIEVFWVTQTDAKVLLRKVDD